MLFNSLHFLLFFVLVTWLYFTIPKKFRWVLLLSSSCYFYMAFVPVYILILGFTIVIDYFAGIYIEKSIGKNRKFFLVLSLIANIGVLAVFKYYNFINSNLTFIFDKIGLINQLPYLSILLPIGLSFHTFQAMSYTIEVYRGNQKAEKHFGIYSLYVMFYPQLVAGPIERPQNIIHQLKEYFDFDYDRVTDGLRLMGWGLFKKIIIADRLAIIVDSVYDNPHQYNFISISIATIFFSFQIYCDFSGYSDMAIGAARVMGFNLMKNFNSPYQSKSISEFWSRWHISLSTWFRDYLYIPLGGNRVAISRWYFNLFVVFLLSGLWHGANWTYIMWGAIHGFYLVFGIITNKIRIKIGDKLLINKLAFLPYLSTFLLVSIAWIFFRANSIETGFFLIKKIFQGFPEFFTGNFYHNFNFEQIGNAGKFEIAFCFLLIIFLEGIQYLASRYNLKSIFKNQSIYLRWAVYYGVIFIMIYFGVFENRQFIYFQF